jgi:hypothetical protein
MKTAGLFIYNVTCRVDAGIADEWLGWMRAKHIPRVLVTGLFTHHRILRLLDTGDDDGQTFAVQYFTTSREAYDRYLAEYAPQLRSEVSERWGEAVLSFRTFMEVIN